MRKVLARSLALLVPVGLVVVFAVILRINRGAVPMSDSRLAADLIPHGIYQAQCSDGVDNDRDGYIDAWRRAASVALKTGETDPSVMLVDDKAGYAYLSVMDDSQTVFKVVEVSLSDMGEVRRITLQPGDGNIISGVLGEPNTMRTSRRFAYFGTNTVPGKIIAVDLDSFTAQPQTTPTTVPITVPTTTPPTTTPPTTTPPTTPPPTTTPPTTTPTTTPPTTVPTTGPTVTPVTAPTIAPTTVPTRVPNTVSRITLNRGQDSVGALVVSSHYLYAVTQTDPSQIIKIDLWGIESARSITLNPGENRVRSAFLDPLKQVLYLGTDTSPGKVVKVDLATFTRKSVLTLNEGESYLSRGVFGVSPYLYFGTNDGVVKVDTTTFKRVAWLNLSSIAGGGILTSIMDPTYQYGYFGTDTAPGRILAVRLTDLRYIKTLTLDPSETSLAAAGMDKSRSLAYFGTYTSPAQLVKVALNDRDCIDESDNQEQTEVPPPTTTPPTTTPPTTTPPTTTPPTTPPPTTTPPTTTPPTTPPTTVPTTGPTVTPVTAPTIAPKTVPTIMPAT